MTVDDLLGCKPNPPTYEEICSFCDEIAGRSSAFLDLGITSSSADYILHSTEHFVVVPCLGALVDWYVLIVPRRHALSAGWLMMEERKELRTLLTDVRRRVERISGCEVAIFEQGSYSFRDRGGSCHDHAHVHVVASERPIRDFVEYVQSSVTLRECGDWLDAAAAMVSTSAKSYLALQASATSFLGDATGAPSGFFRKALLRWLGGDIAEHDWLVFPQVTRLRKMIDTGFLGRSG
ncbi:MAG: HIT domain protein [Candidatus Binatia bacterium]